MDQYFLFLNDIQVGPYSKEEVAALLARSRITGSTPVRRADSAEWRNLGGHEQFADIPAGNGTGVAAAAGLVRVSEDEMRFQCPYCRRRYAGPLSYLGQHIACNSCAEEFAIPETFGAAQKAVPETPGLQDEIPEGDLVCPHCWKSFDRRHVLYISQHPSLIGDPVLGEFEHRRFSPTVFNAQGRPLDAGGVAVSDMACPHCHLRLPATITDLESFYCSIVGAPSSGKSYYLTSLIHKLKESLPEHFDRSLLDPDPLLNQIIDGYERLLFMAVEPDKVVMLPKTQQTGNDFSDQVMLGGVQTELPKPFIFECRPRGGGAGLNLVFYDNAGEHFQPGADVMINPATQHLARSNAILFLFDPINDAKLRRVCGSEDPQITEHAKVSDQSTLFAEMISRLRRHRGMEAADTCPIPLVVVVGKYDAWSHAFPKDLRKLPPYQRNPESGEAALNRNLLLDVSFATREFMLEHAPGVVNTAESFFREVYFLPASNFGVPASRSEFGGIGVIPDRIDPVWVEVPLLLELALADVIPSRCEAPRNTEPGFLPKIVNGEILFRHPLTGRQERLPLNYLGAVLEIGGKRYAMPPATAGNSGRKHPAPNDLWS
ncbi:MAG: DUF4339 domain-containing protein [Lentisphaeria bacterium]|nr:DUF4339 domain-containing protein [Lentisphaeria bacterium]